jgi:hypothetical protein
MNFPSELQQNARARTNRFAIAHGCEAIALGCEAIAAGFSAAATVLRQWNPGRMPAERHAWGGAMPADFVARD